MILENLKALKSYIFADKEYLPLEHRLFLAALIFGILISFLGISVAVFIAIDFTAVYILLFSKV